MLGIVLRRVAQTPSDVLAAGNVGIAEAQARMRRGMRCAGLPVRIFSAWNGFRSFTFVV
jgi:hypothetical protein